MSTTKMVAHHKVQNLDPVTFEVLKNGFVNLVDQMAEQMLRTCYSFVIYNRDFSCALCDAQGNTVMQGTQDISVHVGTLHLTAKAVLEDFADDIHPGIFSQHDKILNSVESLGKMFWSLHKYQRVLSQSLHLKNS